MFILTAIISVTMDYFLRPCVKWPVHSAGALATMATTRSPLSADSYRLPAQRKQRCCKWNSKELL